jgi:hypothetical protein
MEQLDRLIQRIATHSLVSANQKCAQQILDRGLPLVLTDIQVRRLVIRAMANPEQPDIRDSAVEVLFLDLHELASLRLFVPIRAIFGVLLHGPDDVRKVIISHIMELPSEPSLPDELQAEVVATLKEVAEYDPCEQVKSQAETYLLQL